MYFLIVPQAYLIFNSVRHLGRYTEVESPIEVFALWVAQNSRFEIGGQLFEPSEVEYQYGESLGRIDIMVWWTQPGQEEAKLAVT